MKHFFFFLLFAATTSYCCGQQLVYTPKNPAFGGDPFNYTWLLNSANAQNQFNDDFSSLDALGDFDSLLQNQLLQPFNNETPEVGTTREGDLEYEVYESNEGLVINILNVVTGEQSQIIIPNE
ncbi:curli assembly protein CsgF [Rasiella rasia]|uniref:Curli production assembly/transport component CsgF n=1 Tax=Rasiella rasia TaxID=2744027 RepID=A0A6G6GPQ5_9FLAO|nr:curli assembly protein CsgF [Rasiella rasia]QIE60532.1 curli assembly protein CsgF [Rasiella rasia]